MLTTEQIVIHCLVKPPQREAVRLVLIDGLTAYKAAQQTGHSQQTILNNVARVEKTLNELSAL